MTPPRVWAHPRTSVHCQFSSVSVLSSSRPRSTRAGHLDHGLRNHHHRHPHTPRASRVQKVRYLRFRCRPRSVKSHMAIIGYAPLRGQYPMWAMARDLTRRSHVRGVVCFCEDSYAAESSRSRHARAMMARPLPASLAWQQVSNKEVTPLANEKLDRSPCAIDMPELTEWQNPWLFILT